MPRVPHRGAARRTCEDGRLRRRRGGRILGGGRLPTEPLVEAGAAEGVQAVEEGEGLVEQLGADLSEMLGFWAGRHGKHTRTRRIPSQRRGLDSQSKSAPSPGRFLALRNPYSPLPRPKTLLRTSSASFAEAWAKQELAQRPAKANLQATYIYPLLGLRGLLAVPASHYITKPTVDAGY